MNKRIRWQNSADHLNTGYKRDTAGRTPTTADDDPEENDDDDNEDDDEDN
jgi:hypothetical protein